MIGAESLEKHNLISAIGAKFDLFIKRNKFKKFAFRYKIIHVVSKEGENKKTREKKEGNKDAQKKN